MQSGIVVPTAINSPYILDAGLHFNRSVGAEVIVVASHTRFYLIVRKGCSNCDSDWPQIGWKVNIGRNHSGLCFGA